MNKGYVIMAQGSTYEKCAKALETNLKTMMPGCNVTIITTDMLPYGDQVPDIDWKLQNDWQVYEASPYEYTIKLESDMYIPMTIDHWWDLLKDRNIVISTDVRNFKQEISTVQTYRRFIFDNNLPNTYNAITYFKKSEIAKQFFEIVKDVFENWNEYKAILKCNIDEPVTTDWAYAIASHILGKEKTTLPESSWMTMVHMKQAINNLPTERWTDTLLYEILPHSFRINTMAQKYPVHYHIKEFSNIILENYNG